MYVRLCLKTNNRKLKSAFLSRCTLIISLSFQKYYVQIQYSVEIDNTVTFCSANWFLFSFFFLIFESMGYIH